MPGPRRVVGSNAAGAGQEGVRIFGVDAAFDRVAAQYDILLRDAQFSPAATRICSCTISMPVICSGHRVFHLYPGVHLDEAELAVFVQEFERAGAAVADLTAGIRYRLRPWRSCAACR